jgi:hypothetical protein
VQRSGLKISTPLSATTSRGSVQQGLSVAGGALGLFQLGRATDKRYSLGFKFKLRKSRRVCAGNPRKYNNPIYMEERWMTKDERLFSEALDQVHDQLTEVLATLALQRADEAERDLATCREFFTISLSSASASGINPLSQQAKILKILDLAGKAAHAIEVQQQTWWKSAVAAVKGIIASILAIVGLPIPDSLLLEHRRNATPRIR